MYFSVKEIRKMKVFISWSGELSKEIAESLKKWIPCMIQTTEVFFSPDDIEKGENWDAKIASELLTCKYGIVCLTDENVSAPWIHLEAGALAKTLESRVATLMINVSPTDIKGPLSRYQATKIDQKDFYQLICDINSQSDNPNKQDVLETLFNNLWKSISDELNSIIKKYQSNSTSKKKQINNSEAIEEILLLLRKQNSIITSPEQLMPVDYVKYINEHVLHHQDTRACERITLELFQYLHWVLDHCESNPEYQGFIYDIRLDGFIKGIGRFVDKRMNEETFFKYREVRNHFLDVIPPLSKLKDGESAENDDE